MPEQARTATRASRKSLKAAARGWQFIQDDFAQGHTHKTAGKPVVWSCALVEKEIYYSMGLHPFYPEQYSALTAVRRKTPDVEKDAVRFASIAEQHGYSTDLCGYYRTVMGYVINGDLADGPLGGVFVYEPTYDPYPWPARNPRDPLGEMAFRTLLPETELVRGSVEGYRELCREYQVDGVVINSVYTCRPVYLPLLEMVSFVEKKMGIPAVVIDCDLVDERSYSEGQVRTRLDALAERIAAKKGIRLSEGKS